MLNQLLKLYRKERNKTPLEDFTTEAFVGLLNLEEEIKQAFIQDFLKLPESDYHLETQVRYELEGDKNCVIDFVLKGESSICFIENKVNSKEGNRQIERYGKVLDTYIQSEFKTSLFYCTKNYDQKPYEWHNFKQIRWFQVAEFLKQYRESTLANEFSKFLVTHEMAQELTMNAKDFLTLENLQNILNKVNGYLDRVKPIFESKFKGQTKIIDGRSTTQVLSHNRLMFSFKDIISQNGLSEIKYGFQLEAPSIYVGLWVEKSNESYTNLVEESKTLSSNFKIKIKDRGISIELKKDVSVFLNDEGADSKVSDWYKEAFNQFAEIIKRTPNLGWKINVD